MFGACEPELAFGYHEIFFSGLQHVAHMNIRDLAVRLGSFGVQKINGNLKAVRVVSVPLRFGSSRFKKRFGSKSAIRVLPESNSNLGHSLPKPSFLELLSRTG